MYVWLARYQWWGVAPIALIMVATLGWWGTVTALRADPGAVSLRGLVVTIVVVSTVMVVFPPRHTRDVASFSIYGRIVAVHDANPYVDLPSAFADDPVYPEVGRRWVNTPSRYGPLFTGVSAIGASLLPARPLPLRLWFQGITLFGALGVAVLVWRRWRSPAALAFVALHPLMTLSVINGAHNDVFVGLGALAFVMLVEKKRFAAAGFALALAALIKLTAVLALVAAVLWLLSRRQVRGAIVAAAACVVPTLGVMAAVPGCLDAVRSAADINVKNSLWYGVQLYFTPSSWFPVHGPGRSLHDIEQFVKTPALALTALAVLGGVIMVLRRERATAATANNAHPAHPGSGLAVATAVALATFSVFPAWVMPWYLVWALPLVATTGGLASSRIRATMALHGSVMLCASHLRGFSTDHVDVLAVVVQFVIPFGAAIAYGTAVYQDTRMVTTDQNAAAP